MTKPQDIDVQVSGQDPRSPYYGQLLSEGDEKLLDDRGRPVAATGRPWSAAGTDRWLLVYGTKSRLALSPFTGVDTTTFNLGLNRKVGLAVSVGRPRPAVRIHAATMELPSDLGEDQHKREYVTAWLTQTLIDMGDELGVSRQRVTAILPDVADVAEALIKRAGL